MQPALSTRSWLRAAATGLAIAASIAGVNAQAIDTNPTVQAYPQTVPGPTGQAQAPKTKPTILVLGAGMSGVMAATTLFENGFTDIKIIEANDYIGGRMKAGQIGGREIELGANWVHGVGGNPIYDIAINHSLNLVETNWSSVVYLPLDADPNEEKEVEDFEAALEKADERSQRYLDNGKKDLTVSDALRYEGWIPHTPLEQALLFNEMDNDMGPAEDTSFELALNIATYKNDDRDMLVVDAKHYNSLARNLLAQHFPDPLHNANVILNTKVTKIEYSDSGVVVHATSNDKEVTYKADYVITTFSAGVLRNKARDLFVPPLPEDKLDAIYRVDMTLFLKVFVETTERFWSDVTDGTETWIFADEVKGNFTSWMDLSVPKLGEAFSSPKNASYLSLCMIASEFAAEMEKLSDAQLKDEVIKAMKAMFPNAADRITTETVASVVMNKWGTDELFAGSWSNPARDFTKDDFKKLGEPVGRVYFSGEHTSVEYFGYVHGAYRAGIDTANQLMALPAFQ